MPEHAQPGEDQRGVFIYYLLSAVILEQNFPVKEIFSL
jgi:hypothetical protein